MAFNQMAAHETLELLEVMTFKNVCATKSKTMQPFVTDPQLKQILQTDVEKSVPAIQTLSGILQQAKIQ